LVADLLAGVLLYGGIGYLLERFLGVPHALWIGVVVGLVLSIFLVIKQYGGGKK
jgi:F0F1-type ATP synthase assembly protein I